MADPTGYTVSYSFAGFQANSPTTPLPGASLDNELARINTAVASLVAAVLDIRRSDGALKNGVVTFDSFEDGLRLLIDPTNGQLVAAAVATTQANATLTAADRVASAASAASALTQANNAAASAATVNLSLYLAKANNLAELGSLSTSRSNLGLGTAAVLNVGTGANNIVQLNGSAQIPALDGSLLTGMDLVPVGAVMWFPSIAPPAGMRALNGALVSRVGTFARLYAFAAASGNIVSEATWAASNNGAFSTGDLSTTFRLPDLRGEFIRNFDDGRGVDPSRVLGSYQADALKSHTHDVYDTSDGTGGSAGNTVGTGTRLINNKTTATGATETRPRNVSLLACIKY